MRLKSLAEHYNRKEKIALLRTSGYRTKQPYLAYPDVEEWGNDFPGGTLPELLFPKEDMSHSLNS